MTIQSKASGLLANSSQADEGDEVFIVDPSIKARQRERIVVAVARIVFGVSFLLFWEWVSGRYVDPFWISSPSLVAAAFVKIVQGGELGRSIVATVSEAVIGFAFGASIGMCMGVLFGVNRIVAKVLDPYIVGFYSLPRIALIPLFILWFGIGFQTKIIYTALLVFFPVFMNTLSGVKDVNRDLIDVLRVMGASRADTIRKVLIPSALSWLFAGLRISAPYALLGAVVAEMFTSNVGLGHLISYYANILDTSSLFVILAVTTTLGLLLMMTVTWLERRLLRWRPTDDPAF